MFLVTVNETKWEYDVHALVQSFFPGEEVWVQTPDTSLAKRESISWERGLAVTVLPMGARLQFLQNENLGSKEFFTPYRVFLWQPAKADFVLGWDKEFKNGFKRFLYRSLAKATGRILPWGNLTGIRPTKIAMGMFLAGEKEEQVMRFLQEEHYVSPKKAALCVEIAEREQEILSRIHAKEGYSLYIGIPFCPTTCLYCSFTSNPLAKWKGKVETYLDCLIGEIRFVQKECKGRILDSVYIGGGTPTTLTAEQLDRLLGTLRECLDLSTVQEFCVEAGRADSITEEKLLILKKHGVGRISINPQTMKEETLKLIGRQATAMQVKEAFKLARSIGDFNINMDLILGLPGEGSEDVRRTMDEILALRPDSLTVHSLAIKRASKLAQRIRESGMQTFINTEETMELAAKTAAAMDMHPYYLYRQKNMAGNFENVGYATEGNYGIYNILIMEEVQTIVALGAGSITKVVYPDGRIERCENVKEVAQYIDRIDEMTDRKKALLYSLDKG